MNFLLCLVTFVSIRGIPFTVRDASEKNSAWKRKRVQDHKITFANGNETDYSMMYINSMFTGAYMLYY